MNEFELIDRITSVLGERTGGDDVLLGPGDDCALLALPAGEAFVATTDTLVEDRHFPAAAEPADIGYRAIAVNLSDLAAMGARARHCLVAVTTPDADEHWLVGLALGIRQCAERYDVAVVGGNMARGPRSITVTALGSVPVDAALLRSGARVGDAVFVTGTLGAALDHGAPRYRRPEPRLAAGLALRGVATAAADVSDGLLADLGHICRASGVAAEVELERLPVAAGVEPVQAANGGDDYELVFTAPAGARLELDVATTRIGTVVVSNETTAPNRVVLRSGGVEVPAGPGYRHF